MERTVDSRLFDPMVPVLIQGISGRAGRTQAELMQRYGTRVVAGAAISQTAASITGPVAGIPVLASCAEAVASTAARASLIMVPPLGVRAAVDEAINAGLKLVVCITEGV